MRFRSVFLGLGSLITLIFLGLSDPDTGIIQHLPIGASLVGLIIVLMSVILHLSILHWGRKSFLDYIDLQKLFEKAMATSEGSGYAIIGVGIISLSIAVVIHGVVK